MLEGVTPFPADFAARYELSCDESVMNLVFDANAARVLGV